MKLCWIPFSGTDGSAERQPALDVIMPPVNTPSSSYSHVVPGSGTRLPVSSTIVSIAFSVHAWVDSDRRNWSVASIVRSLERHWPAAARPVRSRSNDWVRNANPDGVQRSLPLEVSSR